MKHLYYVLIDTTRDAKDPNQSGFWHQPICNDFAGCVTAFAKHNHVDPSKVRLFFYPTKKHWEYAEQEWRENVDWDIPLMP